MQHTPSGRIRVAMATHTTFIKMRDALVAEANAYEESGHEKDAFLPQIIGGLLNFAGLATYASAQAVYSAHLKRGKEKASTLLKPIEFTDLALEQLGEHAGPTIYSWMKRELGIDPLSD